MALGKIRRHLLLSRKAGNCGRDVNPSFLPVPDSPKPTLVIRAHDENNNITISGIDYRISIEYPEVETLLDQRFRSSDGVVKANLTPDSNIVGWEIKWSSYTKRADRSEPEESR